MRPRRTVQWVDGEAWTVSHSNVTTTDRTLARATRDELDRVDPLPCPHDADRVNVRTFGDPQDRLVCTDCGADLEENQ